MNRNGPHEGIKGGEQGKSLKKIQKKGIIDTTKSEGHLIFRVQVWNIESG